MSDPFSFVLFLSLIAACSVPSLPLFPSFLHQWNASNVPARTTGTTRPAPPDVGSVPAGASPLGVLDLMGLVWQWTNEFADAHTRAGLVRGGAYYRPTVNAHGGQSWYFRADISDGGGVHANAHGKVLLMAPAYDRHGTVGFRCVADA